MQCGQAVTGQYPPLQFRVNAPSLITLFQVFAASDDEYEDDYAESRALLAVWESDRDARRLQADAARLSERNAEVERLLEVRQKEWLANWEQSEVVARAQRTRVAAEQEEAMSRLLKAKESVWQTEREEAVRKEAERVKREMRAALEAELRADIEHEVREDMEAKWRELWSGNAATTKASMTTGPAKAATGQPKDPNGTTAHVQSAAPKRRRLNAGDESAAIDEALPDAADAAEVATDAENGTVEQMFSIDFFDADADEIDVEPGATVTYTYVDVSGRSLDVVEADGGEGDVAAGDDQPAQQQQPNAEYLDDVDDEEEADDRSSIIPVAFDTNGELMMLDEQDHLMYEDGEQQPSETVQLQFACSEDGELQPIDEEDTADDSADQQVLDFTLDMDDDHVDHDGQLDTGDDNNDNNDNDDDDEEYVPPPTRPAQPAAARRSRRQTAADASANAATGPDHYRYTVKSSGPDQTTQVEVATGVGDEVLMVELVHASRSRAVATGASSAHPAAKPTLQTAANGATVFACEPCGLQFATRQLHGEHASATHAKPLGHVCQFCDRAFPSKSSLVRHVRRHTGEKPFGCDVCGRTFIQKEVLKRHVQVHTGERPYACDQCERTFTQREMLRQHVNRQHAERPVIDLHKCGKCSKKFFHASGLSRHMSLHLGKKFTCDVCDKQFNDKSALRRHEGAMHGVERQRAVTLTRVA